MLISLTAFSGAILNTHSRFWVAAFTPVLLNIAMIAAALVAVTALYAADYWTRMGRNDCWHPATCFSMAISEKHPHAAASDHQFP